MASLTLNTLAQRATMAGRFLIAGGSATLLHWSVMTVLVLLTLPPVIATSVGAVCGAAANFWLQGRVTFGVRPGAHLLPRYLQACLLGWCVNALLFAALYHSGLLPIAVAQLITTALVTLFNFVLYKEYVYHATADR